MEIPTHGWDRPHAKRDTPLCKTGMLDIQKLLQRRDMLRKEKKFSEADEIRHTLVSLGYTIEDSTQMSNAVERQTERIQSPKHYLALFGSGETSSIGRSVYDYVLSRLKNNSIRISIITSPAGFQPNVQTVHEEIAEFIHTRLKNYHPNVSIIYANTKSQANDPAIVGLLDGSDIIFMGPGSPTYAATVLEGSLLVTKIVQLVESGSSLFLSSAAVLAFSRFVLPVYEIFKVGEPLHWKKGLDLLSKISDETTCIPHWNNTEGMPKLDTSCCFMGEARFTKLKALLPSQEPLTGIDEQTAMIIDLHTKEKICIGKGHEHTL